MDERFTERMRKLLYIARQEAASHGNDSVTAEHILLALIKEGSGVAVMVLTNLGVNLEKISRSLNKLISEGEVGGLASGEIPLGQDARHIISLAIDEAKKLDHKHVGTEHLLLGLLRKRDGAPARILSEYGVSYDIAKSEISSTMQRTARNRSRLHSTISAVTLRALRKRISLTRSSEGRRRSNVLFRCFREERRTIRFSSVSRVSERPPLQRVLPRRS
jgi:ATP-dependent Clp protease ATP-binding subunit ClpA